MTDALDGLRVVDLSHYLAGPLVASLLGGFGADVVRVDPPSGPRWTHPANAMLQRNKRSIALDLRAPSDLDVARRLVARADVVIENFRPGVAERLGIGPSASLAANPSLVYCSIPGFAASDPRAGVAAWEGVVCAAGGIYVPRSADPDDDPSYNSVPYASSFGAVVAAHSVLAALIVRERTGRGQHVESPLFDALFEAIGHFGLRVDGGPAPRTPAEFAAHGGAAPHGGFYRCADGRWIHLCLIQHRHLTRFAERFFPADWVADGMADADRMGGVDTDSDLRSSDPGLAARARRRFAELFATRSAAEWERLINDELGCPTAACLTTAEWLDDEHARIVGAVLDLDDPQLGPVAQAGHPIVLAGTPARPPRPRRALDADRAEILAELETVPPRDAPIPDAVDAPLRGLRVLDCSQVLAGPTSSRILAEYGADVVKVMSPYDGQIMAHAYTNSGKRSIMLDLRTEEGRRIYLALSADADVVVENFSLGTTDRMGIGEHTVRAANPDVVYASVSSYGWWDGPRSAWRGREELGQAVTGTELRWGGADSPRMQPFALNDYGAGNWAAVAVLLGLYHRYRGGRGQHVHTSLAHAATFHRVPDMIAGPGVDAPSAAGTVGPSATDRLYRARDRWLYLAAGRRDARDVLAALDPGGDDLAAAVAAHTARTVVDRLCANGIAAEPVATVEEVMEDGRTRARGLSLRADLPGAGRCRVLGPSPRLSATPPRPTAASSAPGADGRSVLDLVDLGDAFDHLVATGVVHAALPPGVALVGRVRAAI